jgi:hypothetical protein
MNRAVSYVCIFASLLAATAAYALTPEQAAERSRLELPVAPPQASSVVPLLKKLKAQPEVDGRRELKDVTLVGQIGGMPNPWKETHPDFPWFKNQASFFVLDSKLAQQFAHHAHHHGGHHDCTFCQNLAAKNAHAVAVVNLTDENGKILKVDSRDLLGLEEKQTVVVRGRAELLGGTMMVLHADGIHVRR